jgi:putative transposase
MARLARAVAAGVPHHITQRGNRRQPVFFGHDDYHVYQQLMAEWIQKHGVEVWAYCLMPNHVHLVAVPSSEEALARAIGEAHRRYTRMIHFREDWRGYLWQGRFASYAMDENHLLNAVRYIEMNPVRARMVQHPWEYEWSSARAHVRGRNDLLVNVKPMKERVENWREFLKTPLSDSDTKEIRFHLRTGRPMGSASFIDHLETQLGRALRPGKRGPKPRPRD